MSRRKRPLLTAREILILSILTLIGLATVGALTFAVIRWASLVPGGGAFYPIWAGSREFLFQGGDPYGVDGATIARQLASDEFSPGELDSYRLSVPFFLLPFFFPFALISDPVVARGVWAVFGQAALIGTLFLTMTAIVRPKYPSEGFPSTPARAKAGTQITSRLNTSKSELPASRFVA